MTGKGTIMIEIGDVVEVERGKRSLGNRLKAGDVCKVIDIDRDDGALCVVHKRESHWIAQRDVKVVS